jgi:hypothetical protein
MPEMTYKVRYISYTYILTRVKNKNRFEISVLSRVERAQPDLNSVLRAELQRANTAAGTCLNKQKAANRIIN